MNERTATAGVTTEPSEWPAEIAARFASLSDDEREKLKQAIWQAMLDYGDIILAERD